ncbi:hypothetical protein M9H77_03995 [Catharanthus roseus]|uniref:Uncharacterized protein n=1 Tax=Catharanthus roseus TaxID=4058 RepID=A0ACC0CD46_CATRO|nr:hypothetical protein M9H77_03995 [Catharanthus roseus]
MEEVVIYLKQIHPSKALGSSGMVKKQVFYLLNTGNQRKKEYMAVKLDMSKKASLGSFGGYLVRGYRKASDDSLLFLKANSHGVTVLQAVLEAYQEDRTRKKLFLFEGSNEEEDRWMEGEVSFNNREEDFGEAVLQSMPTYDCVTS